MWNILFEAYFFSPVYNVETDPDQAGLLGFDFPFMASPGYIELSARTGGDYGLDATLKGIEQIIPPEGAELTLWGVPAEPSHNAFRAPLGAEGGTIRKPEPESEVPGSPARLFPSPAVRALPSWITRPTAANQSALRSKFSPGMVESVKKTGFTPRQPVATNSASTPASAPSQPPLRPTQPQASKWISVFPKRRALKPPRPQRSVR